MSSYIDVVHPERHAPYLDIPDDVVDYLHYLDFVKAALPAHRQRVLSRPARLLPLYDAALAARGRRYAARGN